MTITYKAVQISVDDSSVIRALCSTNFEKVDALCNKVELLLNSFCGLITKVGALAPTDPYNEVNIINAE